MAFKKIMLYGGGGNNIGHHILQALARDGAFKTTVLARESSKTVYPASVSVAKVPDDFPHEALVQAMQGQDVVICAPVTHQDKVLDAALEVGVKRFLPSEFGMDNDDPKNQALSPIFKSKYEFAKLLQLKESETFSWTAFANSIWLDWALDTGYLGIDPAAHTVQYWANGTFRTTMTSLPYAALAIVQSLKHLKATKDRRIFISPFEATQREVVTELEKLQGVKYTVSHVSEDITEETHARIVAGDEAAVGVTITAGVLLPEYRANFKTSGKQPLADEIADLPHLSLQDVIGDWVKAHPQ